MEVLVIGAGVVGLAAARAIARRGHAVVVAEQAAGIGTGASSRNSEVIHAGLHHPTGSAKARHCVAGNRMLYDYCASHGIGHARCGKLIVATDAPQAEAITRIHTQGADNGVANLRMLDGPQARALEPALACQAALLSADTGIVDSHALLLALRGDLEDAGGMIALRTEIERVCRQGTGWVAHHGGESPGRVPIDAVVNAAGLGAQAMAAATDGYPACRVPSRVLAKGSYFGHARRSPFTRLIYPAPVEGGLGIHVTMDLAGRLRFGPDVEWVEHESYDVDPARATAFGAAIRRYWPALRDEDLAPGYAGVRPKLSGPGEPPADFVVDTPADHGLAGLVHLFGIESPGLTASLSLAETIADALEA